MGPDGWSRQHNKRVHRKSRVRVWLGGADAAHVILAARTALSAGLNHAQSQRDAPLISLSITIFYPMTSDSTKKIVSLCSTVIVHLVSIWGSLMFINKKRKVLRMGEQISWKQILGVAFQITRTQQKIWQHDIAAAEDSINTVRGKKL